MEISQIEAFERVVRDGSFTRAAEMLGLTQPAVSTRITALEAELGGALFERRGRQLYLTPLGEYFLPYAERLLAVVADSLQAVRNFNKGLFGEVRIAAPTPFVLSFLVDTLEQFRLKYPSVDILIRERNKTTIYEMLHDHAVTLGLVNAPVFDKRFVQLLRLADPIRAVVAPTHPLARLASVGTMVPMEAVFQHTIFRVSMFPQMTAFMDTIVEQGRRGSGGAVIAVPMVMALKLVLLGQGISFLPESYVKPAVENGELAAITLEHMPSLVSEPIVIALRDRKLDHSHLEFVHILKTRWRHLVVDMD